MQQGGAIAVFPQNCSPAQVGGFAQAFVVVPQWTAAQQQQPQQWCSTFMPAQAPATHCAPSRLEQQQEVKAAPKDSVALIGGVFGIAGVSKLPAAGAAGKGSSEKAKSSRRRARTNTNTNMASFLPAQQQQVAEVALPSTAKKSSERKQTRATTAPTTLAAKVAPQQVTPEVEVVEEVSSPVTVTCASSSSSPTGSWQQFEKRAGRRWADIADEEDEDEDALGSDCGAWDSKCGSHSFSDVASTRGSSSGDCTDTESSEDDA
mmetsp:Transcript_74179/g.176695  ORF Transcript_74179/g.176695 Transcript_74179/m.176695 type:complete len:262 (+) Transcript_74179:95-880(+)|eukprot:CAMPEP_0178411418 /NCGR_PEP_ID=MMETSP0689_2-20121128/21484_1 /TAXON_ID=160604 /ORGANISM="Amphidinium massartii, Strain CS-259" /LENGTH=261 /DNA_ID=CAMNT_0020032623 /DNA_START=94 /DNA_END=879 /DNA_ORIENTATION=+